MTKGREFYYFDENGVGLPTQIFYLDAEGTCMAMPKRDVTKFKSLCMIRGLVMRTAARELILKQIAEWEAEDKKFDRMKEQQNLLREQVLKTDGFKNAMDAYVNKCIAEMKSELGAK